MKSYPVKVDKFLESENRENRAVEWLEFGFSSKDLYGADQTHQMHMIQGEREIFTTTLYMSRTGQGVRDPHQMLEMLFTEARDAQRSNNFTVQYLWLDRSGAAKEDGASSISTVKPGTPGPGGRHTVSRSNSRKVTAYSRRTHGGSPVFGGGGASTPSRRRGTLDANFHGSSGLFCQKCGEKFRKPDAVEAHFFSSHAVTELAEGDSSRRVVEIICRTGWSRTESGGCRIERILKVHSMQRTLAQFEEYRESVKIKACKLPRKHPRCVADGNELLRFYGTTIACSLGKNGSSCLCTSEKCGACHILRHGFSMNSEINGSGGIFTTSTGGRAFASIELDQEKKSLRKALLVCRVIAGRVSQSLEKFQDVAGQSGLNSVARKVRRHSNIEELFLLNPRALLPCFVIMF
ncbi:uncharacterized protein LOC119990108 isoform X2 [Tripterygium wilfordii]|uniref:uncharacterized protein LOC119990108 isoform X2 n=1 Tax=Tripterygium wilfordii TaxID=458696 RepID=UPI0018F81CAD|nr:uncharacterized protein LOC119990108 isoform X2 [Tripterygium wilfordii]